MENQNFLLSVWNDALILKTDKFLSSFKKGVKTSKNLPQKSKYFRLNIVFVQSETKVFFKVLFWQQTPKSVICIAPLGT